MKESLWLYAIHGNNLKMIHILEENLKKPQNEEYTKYFFESINCQHNDICKLYAKLLFTELKK